MPTAVGLHVSRDKNRTALVRVNCFGISHREWDIDEIIPT